MDKYSTCSYSPFLSETCRNRNIAFGMNSERFAELVQSHLPMTKNPGLARIADVGCGTGKHSIALAKALPHLFIRGFEPARDLFPLAMENLALDRQANIVFSQLTAHDAGERFPHHFDLVVSNLVGCFTSSFAHYLNDLRALTAPGGVVILNEFFLSDLKDPKLKSASSEFLLRTYSLNSVPMPTAKLIPQFQAAGFDPHLFQPQPVIEVPPDKRSQPANLSADRLYIRANLIAKYFLEPDFFDAYEFNQVFVLRAV